jgi:hypothetical protein
LKGYGFSQAATQFAFVLKGRGFSHAATQSKTRALDPEGLFLAMLDFKRTH